MYKYCCEQCGKGVNTQKEARKIFKRQSQEGKEFFKKICKECEDKNLKNSEWDGDKLKCRICGEFKHICNFSKSKSYSKLRNNYDYRCNECKVKQNHIRRLNYSNEQKIENILISRINGAKDRAIKNKYHLI